MAEKPCLFCAIRDKQEPALVVYEDEHLMALLDVKPLFKGHVLVIPKEHHVTLMDLPTDQIPHLMSTVQRISVAVRAAMGADGIFNAINNGVSQSVAHLHIHVVPRRKKDGLKGFMWPRLKYDINEDEAIADAIRSAL